MNRILIVIFVIFSYTLFSGTNKNDVFKRLMEYAHPTPEENVHFESPALVAGDSKLPYFLNVSTVIDEENEGFKMQNESSIAVNPTNPNNLIASSVDYRDDSSTWVYVSDDGGKNWRNINLGKPFSEWRSTNDPSVAFNTDGVGFLVYGGFGERKDSSGMSFGENGVFFARSTDQGATWEAHIPVILHQGKQTPDSAFEDKYYIEVDNSPESPYFHHMYIPWKRVTPRDSATQIVVSKSIDSGSTWSRPVPVSYRLPNTSEDTTYGQSFPLITTGPEGEVYLVWNHGIEHGVGFARSTDGGEKWTEPRIIQNYKIFGETKFLQGQGYRHSVKGKVRAETYPVIMCDYTQSEYSGTLYLTWAGDRIPNIYFSKSTDKGDTWSEPKIIHSDLTNDQFWQWLSIDPTNGDLACMYFDSRNDPENLLVECYVSYSSDGGETWTDRQVADEGTDLRLNPFTGNSFAGDYSGLAFYGGMLYHSWVDMRSAVEDIRDSDVFTAIVNVNAPAPVENFNTKVIPQNPELLDLSWLAPSEYSFGQPLNDEDYQIRLYRNNEFLKTLEGGTEFLADSTVSPYTKYVYDIYCVTATDSSIIRTDSAYAGGVASPDAPYISNYSGNPNKDVDLDVYLPVKRADGITPFVNLNGIKLYRDDLAVNTFDAAPADTGSTVALFDKPDASGFYDYRATVIDKYDDIVNESSSSNKVSLYTGESLLQQYESFDNLPLPKYFKRGKWQVTDEVFYDGDNSLTIAPYEKYQTNQSDTLILFPMEIKDDLEKYILHFMNIAEVFQNDDALIEVSFDNMETWEEIASYNEQMYEYWQDGIVNANDWRYEIIEIPLADHKDSDRMYVRFRFASNSFAESNGWYIDRVKIDEIITGVDEEVTGSLNVYPNPASEIITIRYNNIFYKNINEISIYDLFGNKFNFTDHLIQISKNELKLNVNELTSGVYILQIKDNNKTYVEKINIMK